MRRHEFVQIPKDARALEGLNYRDYFDDRGRARAGVIALVLGDRPVWNNTGAYSQADAERATPARIGQLALKFFSGFVACSVDGQPRVGLDYYGVTILKDDALGAIAARGLEGVRLHGLGGRRAAGRFVAFCADAEQNGRWVAHFGP